MAVAVVIVVALVSGRGEVRVRELDAHVRLARLLVPLLGIDLVGQELVEAPVLVAVGREHVRGVQEAVATFAEVDERRADRGLEVHDLAAVDVVDERLVTSHVHLEVDDATVLDHRHARLLAVDGVDEDDVLLARTRCAHLFLGLARFLRLLRALAATALRGDGLGLLGFRLRRLGKLVFLARDQLDADRAGLALAATATAAATTATASALTTFSLRRRDAAFGSGSLGALLRRRLRFRAVRDGSDAFALGAATTAPATAAAAATAATAALALGGLGRSGQERNFLERGIERQPLGRELVGPLAIGARGSTLRALERCALGAPDEPLFTRRGTGATATAAAATPAAATTPTALTILGRRAFADFLVFAELGQLALVLGERQGLDRLLGERLGGRLCAGFDRRGAGLARGQLALGGGVVAPPSTTASSAAPTPTARVALGGQRALDELVARRLLAGVRRIGASGRGARSRVHVAHAGARLAIGVALALGSALASGGVVVFVRSDRLRAGSESRRQLVPEGALIHHDDKVPCNVRATPCARPRGGRDVARATAPTCGPRGQRRLPSRSGTTSSPWSARGMGRSAQECARARRSGERGEPPAHLKVDPDVLVRC